ncbi:hypothetical protein [Xenorhabdus sp. PB30.3]|uniref:hypothetical protein n=1 Tax=Xenorhabdus sp. PB30.3 TaxID=2788941 RepID=UPI001E2FE3BF|nr:hypothetical protein [Xenorhabdus sp. PB30.3]MCC8379552.1 hypothetical protein [Xenorhabdus sp. PB30.3]
MAKSLVEHKVATINASFPLALLARAVAHISNILKCRQMPTKVLHHIWKNELGYHQSIYHIETNKYVA